MFPYKVQLFASVLVFLYFCQNTYCSFNPDTITLNLAEDDTEAACTSPLFWSGRQNVTIDVNGVDRIFELYVPWHQRCDPKVENDCGTIDNDTGPPDSGVRDKYGVIINWHGCCKHYPILEFHDQISKVTEIAQQKGNYFTIQPVGTPSADGSGSIGWNGDGVQCGGENINDFEFFEAILNFIDTKLCSNKKKIYSVGFSFGGFLTYGIGCRYPNRIKAIGADAGSLGKSYASTCVSYESENGQSGAVPVQSFHSLSDNIVPFNGTDTWLPQEDVDKIWRIRNGCKDNVHKAKVSYLSSTTICHKWECPLAPVESCALKNHNHCWYGGRSGGLSACEVQPGDVDVTNHMFEFWESLDE